MEYIVGIDPGKKGAIALISKDGKELKYIVMCEPGEMAAWLLGNIVAGSDIIRVYVERAQTMPRQGIVSAFTYGTGYGMILGVLEAMSLPYETLRPMMCQRKMIPGTKSGETKKNALIKAKQLFPKETFIQKRCSKPHDGVVDAILIAEYGRGKHFE